MKKDLFQKNGTILHPNLLMMYKANLNRTQRLFFYYIMKVIINRFFKNNDSIETITFKNRDLFKTLNIAKAEKKYFYKHIASLSTTKIIFNDDKIETCTLLSNIIRKKNSQDITVIINKSIINAIKNFIDLNAGNYTILNFQSIKNMKYSHSMLLYAFLKFQSSFKHSHIIDITTLKQVFALENKYSIYSSFKQHVLDKIILDINENTDLYIHSIAPIKEKNKNVSVEFIFQKQQEPLQDAKGECSEFKKQITTLKQKNMTQSRYVNKLYETIDDLKKEIIELKKKLDNKGDQWLI